MGERGIQTRKEINQKVFQGMYVNRIIRTNLNSVVRFDPRLGIEIMQRVAEIKERIEELRNNRPWDK